MVVVEVAHLAGLDLLEPRAGDVDLPELAAGVEHEVVARRVPVGRLDDLVGGRKDHVAASAIGIDDGQFRLLAWQQAAALAGEWRWHEQLPIRRGGPAHYAQAY